MQEGDPGDVVTAAAAGVRAQQPYADPTPQERRDGATGLARLMIGDLDGAAQLLQPLGFTLSSGVDPATGRRFALAAAQDSPETARRWGVYLADVCAPPGLCIAVPHPRSDSRCEQLALRLWRQVPGSLLALATVHRDAAGGTADHARNPDSLFHQLWTTVLGPHGFAQIQLHGFADRNPAEQVAVCTGAGPASPLALRIANGIAVTGLATTRGWDGTADVRLRATRNVQGIAAAANGWVWVHVEHNRTVRDDAALAHRAIDAIALAVSGDWSGGDADARLIAELIYRGEQDQRVRSPTEPGVHTGVLSPEAAQEWQRVDDENARWLGNLVREQGWPSAARVGRAGSRAAWLFAQHADHHPELQRGFLAELTAAVDRGEASGQHLAYLIDRVRVNAGEPQLYGTQFAVVDGVLGPQPIEDPANLDQRRAEAGLEPFAEYERVMREL